MSSSPVGWPSSPLPFGQTHVLNISLPTSLIENKKNEYFSFSVFFDMVASIVSIFAMSLQHLLRINSSLPVLFPKKWLHTYFHTWHHVMFIIISALIKSSRVYISRLLKLVESDLHILQHVLERRYVFNKYFLNEISNLSVQKSCSHVPAKPFCLRVKCISVNRLKLSPFVKICIQLDYLKYSRCDWIWQII